MATPIVAIGVLNSWVILLIKSFFTSANCFWFFMIFKRYNKQLITAKTRMVDIKILSALRFKMIFVAFGYAISKLSFCFKKVDFDVVFKKSGFIISVLKILKTLSFL